MVWKNILFKVCAEDKCVQIFSNIVSLAQTDWTWSRVSLSCKVDITNIFFVWEKLLFDFFSGYIYFVFVVCQQIINIACIYISLCISFFCFLSSVCFTLGFNPFIKSILFSLIKSFPVCNYSSEDPNFLSSWNFCHQCSEHYLDLHWEPKHNNDQAG